MARRLQRNLTGRESLTAGQYFVDGVVHVACPECGAVAVLDRARFECRDCPFVDWVELERD